MSGTESKKQFRWLLADDNAISLKPLIAMLTGLEQIAKTAANGKEALDLMRKEAFDIVLLDCNMPIMDGFKTAEEIRKKEKLAGTARIPILALTSLNLKGMEKECRSAGMDDYIVKPLTVKTLNSIIEKLSAPPAKDKKQQE